jgi:hypothetical protein
MKLSVFVVFSVVMLGATASVIPCDQDYNADDTGSIDFLTRPPRIPKIPKRPPPRPKPGPPRIPKRREFCFPGICTPNPSRCPRGFLTRKKGNCWACCRDIIGVAIELDVFEVEQDGGDEGEFQFDEYLD